MAHNYKYKAFISYSHVDRSWANWLHRKLEAYRTPTRLRGTESRLGEVPTRLSPVFKDREELAAAHDLSATIRDALVQSQNLIVICSPASAQSRWVNKEIEFFKQLGRSEFIQCLIIDGDPGGSPESDCFAPALRQCYNNKGTPLDQPVEPVAANLRADADGKSLALLKIIAALLGVDLDTLRRREQQRRNRRFAITAFASLMVSAVMITLAISATLARDQARQRQQQAEELLGFMVGDLRQSLQPLGRLDLLESVGQQAQAYFATVDIGALTETELLRQAEVLKQLGEIRLEQLDYTDALALFFESFERSSLLFQREPEDGERLFNRSQAEFWVGFVEWRSGNLIEARQWMSRYLDSALALIALDPTRDDWVREVGYGYHNLAVINFESGALEESVAGLEDEIDILNQLIATAPGASLMRDLADARSWLGNVYFARGNLIQALANYRLAERQIREIYSQQPENAVWIDDLAFAVELVAYHEALTGNLDVAADTIEESVELFRQLVTRDPANRNSLRGLNKSEVTQAYIRIAQGQFAVAFENLQRILATLQLLLNAGNADHNVRHLKAQSELLLTWLQLQTGEYDNALMFLEGAQTSLDEIAELTPLNDQRKGMQALALILQGSVHVARGEELRATQAWQEAEQLLSPLMNGTESPWLHEPWARLLTLLGRESESRQVIDALSERRYVPLLPWAVQSSF